MKKKYRFSGDVLLAIVILLLLVGYFFYLKNEADREKEARPEIIISFWNTEITSNLEFSSVL